MSKEEAEAAFLEVTIDEDERKALREEIKKEARRRMVEGLDHISPKES